MNIDDVVNKVKDSLSGISISDEELKDKIRMIVDDISRRTRYFREYVAFTIHKNQKSYDISSVFPSGYIEVMDVITEDGESLFDWFDIVDDKIVVDDDILEKYDGKELMAVAIVYPTVEAVREEEFKDILPPLIAGLKANERDLIDNTEDVNNSNFSYQQYLSLCSSLFNKKPQYRVGWQVRNSKPRSNKVGLD